MIRVSCGKGLAKLMFALALAAPVFGAGSITLTPQNESIGTGAARQIKATVTGLANPALTWSATAGSIDSTGLYTAPATVPSPAAVTVRATSVMDPAVYGTSTLTVKPAGATLTSIAPANISAGPVVLVLTGSGFVNGAVIYLNGKALPGTFNSATKMSSNTWLSQGVYIVTVINPGAQPSNSLQLSIAAPSGGSGGSAGSLTVTPPSASVTQGLTQQFTANQTVTWSASAGTITAAGLYTAPAIIPSPNPVTITATGANNATVTASATITSNAPPLVSGLSQSPLPLGTFTATVAGTGFTASSQAALGTASLTTTFVSATQLSVTGFAGTNGSLPLTVANGPVSAPFPVQVGIANPQVSAAASRRFLEQAAFGPSPADAAHLQQIGFQSWLTEQFNTPVISSYQSISNQSGMGPRFIANAVTNSDQLRQRTAFVWSQIFVTSLNKIIWTDSMAPYQQLLLADAFANYRQILSDVTLHPVMACYLDMGNNAKGNAQGSTLPNENYAREVLQLFSIGPSLLNPDGTQQVDASGIPLPAYNQQTISEFARVFTGWSYSPATAGAQPYFGAYVNPNAPLIAWPACHDAGSKTLLNGAVIPAGLTPKQDLDAALDNIFSHPNTPPFISRLLIQHLVKSNPSPAYVSRVGAAFIDNGSGVRGDMKAVLTAILLDPEARQNDTGGGQLTDGHLQEPALYIAGIFRALAAQIDDRNYFNNDLTAMNQDVYNAPSVFNYYSPAYRVPGFGVGGPEFQIYSPHTSLYRMNFVSNFFYNYQGNIQAQGPGASVDLNPYVALASTPATLVDALDLAFTHGTMPNALKQTLVNAVTTETAGSLRRVQTGLFLLLTSGFYNVWH